MIILPEKMKKYSTPTLVLLLMYFGLSEMWAQVPHCDTNEPNDSYLQATPIVAKQQYSGGIEFAGDVDFYVLTIPPEQPNIRIKLSELPANYDLWLVNNEPKIVAKSSNQKKINEIIIYNLAPPGTYYLIVFHPKNKFEEGACYNLKFELSPFQFRNSTEETEPESQTLTIGNNFSPDAVTLIMHPPVEEVLSVDVFTLGGQKVACFPSVAVSEDGRSTIDLSHLYAGVYVIRCIGASGYIAQTPCVLMR